MLWRLHEPRNLRHRGIYSADKTFQTAFVTSAFHPENIFVPGFFLLSGMFPAQSNKKSAQLYSKSTTFSCLIESDHRIRGLPRKFHSEPLIQKGAVFPPIPSLHRPRPRVLSFPRMRFDSPILDGYSGVPFWRTRGDPLFMDSAKQEAFRVNEKSV